MAGPYAFVTLVSSDAYLPGALAQVAALRDVHPHPPVYPEVPFHTVCLVTPETVDVATIKLLRRAFNLVVGVEVLEQEDNKNLKLLGRPDLTTVLTKLHVFRLVQYSKIVFLDADVLPIRPLSHLFNIKHEFAAAPDVGWPDIFNSGVLVLSPGQDKFDDLNELLKIKGSWDGGDQGLLNEWRAGDWHRLSFTYNTTPTAAYTYAPAYERYGSQINAIHFIGPNKPWKSIPFRSPFSTEKSVVSDTSSVSQAYDYESLVDRWFAVYDRHYRSQPIVPPSFEVKRYTSAWDEPSPLKNTEFGSRQTGLLSLEDLRKMAIEGMNKADSGISASSNAQPGEGEYRSMPIGGRFDLMRPRKEETDSEDDATTELDSSLTPEPKLDRFLLDTDPDLPMTPITPHLNITDDHSLWHALPTPNPNEMPPSPKLWSKSLPTTPNPLLNYYASSAGQTSDSEEWGSSENPGDQPSDELHHLFAQTPSNRPVQPKGGPFADTYSPSPQLHRGSLDRGISYQYSPSISERQPGTDLNKNGTPPRPSSPPLLVWNPAIEPPPKVMPTFSGFPTDTYFTNAWDETHTRKDSLTQKNSPGHPSEFFQPPPPPQIPEVLRVEGHYRNVTGDNTSGSTLSPDRSKVKHVFPWEDKPRQLPGRTFPDSDAPSPALFLSRRGSQTSTAVPSTPESKLAHPSQMLSPLQGLPTNLSYSNAWDNVPSIQNYASRLVRPPQIPPVLAPASGDKRLKNKDHGKTRDEKLEASSFDGDDEDEGDDDVREPDSDDGGRSRPRSRNVPFAAEDTRRAQQSAQKVYRAQGVQTAPREKRHQGVQVSIVVEPTKSHDRSNRPSLTGKLPVTTTGVFGSLPSNRTSDFLLKSGAAATPEPNQPRFIKPPSPSVSPSRPSREFITSPLSNPQRPPAKPVSTRAPDPAKATTSTRAGALHGSIIPSKNSLLPKVPTPPVRPLIQTNRHGHQTGKTPLTVSRQISNDSSIGSPASSVGPISPPDDQPITAPARQGTRVWDPARGVELFKRGSEEVLARFLKMGSWDEASR